MKFWGSQIPYAYQHQAPNKEIRVKYKVQFLARTVQLDVEPAITFPYFLKM